ncbi:MAG: site-specific DNA-methyltransferase [Bacteroidales bacterium]|nr:site-specific DNA-methyltransferase [Bacteroidales bacterium]
MKERASRNKTLILTDEERRQLSSCLLPAAQVNVHIGLVNRTIWGDSMALLPHLPEQFADLIIVDPPYNLSKNFNGFQFKATSVSQYLEYLRSWFPQLCKLLKPNGSLYLCGDWRSTAALQQVMAENLTVLNRITWQREKGRGAANNWKNGMEDIWFGVKDRNNYYFDLESVKLKKKVLAPYRENGRPKDWKEDHGEKFRLTCPSNFWDDITVPYWSMPENTDHPTQKPEKLIAKLILASCPPDGLVFDPFLGSGTTSVVAKKLGRKYLGIEMNMEYCLWAEKRLLLADENSRIQGYEEGVFKERNTH